MILGIAPPAGSSQPLLDSLRLDESTFGGILVSEFVRAGRVEQDMDGVVAWCRVSRT